jgi:DNA-binding response OmpR family regulator
VREYLESSGYTVVEARNGAEAIGKADQADGSIDLLIADMVLPGAGGFEVARALAGRNGMRTVFISGPAQAMLDEKGTLPPGAQVLPRLFAKRDLLKTVRNLLRPEYQVH